MSEFNLVLPKIETEMDELFSRIQLTISGKLSTLENKFANKKSEIYRSAKSNYRREIATALAELYDKEMQRVKLSKWKFVAKYMAKYLPEEYQPHQTADVCQAWKDIVRHHKSRN